MGKPILCVDFDGVIHSYSSGWKGPLVIADPPVPGAIEWLWNATKFFDVKVYSSRSKEPGAIDKMRDYIREHAHAVFPLGHPMCTHAAPYPIDFCYEKPAAFLTIDDRAICFEGDFSVLDPQTLLNFKPWNKR